MKVYAGASAAARHYVEADRIMKKCRRSTVKAPRIMGSAYHTILHKLVKRGFAAPRAPVTPIVEAA